MDITVNRIELRRGEVEAITSALRKFERMRSVPGLVLIGGIALVAIVALPAAVAVVGVAGFVLMGVLTVSWLRTARRASMSALACTGPCEVVVSASSIAVASGGTRRELQWADVLHATKTRAGWIFVAKRTGGAVALPNRILTDADVGRLTGLLSAWPARRYRRAPW